VKFINYFLTDRLNANDEPTHCGTTVVLSHFVFMKRVDSRKA